MMVGAGGALKCLVDELRLHDVQPSPPAFLKIVSYLTSHFKCAKRAGLGLTPKHHLLCHMIHRTAPHKLRVQDCLAANIRIPPHFPLRWNLRWNPDSWHRIVDHGSPKLYHCFRDEGLNAALRDIAQFCHRATFSSRVFKHLDLQSRLDDTSIFARRGTWLPLVAGSLLL
eukprot:5672875-Pyramimonas_sp.AAC.1